MILIKDVLGKALKSVKLGEAADLAFLSSNWGRIVGEQLAAVSRPARIVKKRLIIDVRDGAFLEPMDYSREKIKRNIRAEAGTDVIDDIKIRLSENR